MVRALPVGRGAQTGARARELAPGQRSGPAPGWATHPGRPAAPRRRGAAGPAWPQSGPKAAPGPWPLQQEQAITAVVAEPLSGGRIGLRVLTRQGAAPGYSQPAWGRGGAGRGAQVCERDRRGREGGAWAPGRVSAGAGGMGRRRAPGSLAQPAWPKSRDPGGGRGLVRVLGSPRPQFPSRVCLPAAEMKPGDTGGGDRTRARKEMDQHVQAVEKSPARTPASARAQLCAFGKVT